MDEGFENNLQISSGHQITGDRSELHLAARKGDLETVKFLTDKKHQNPLQKDEYGDTALHAAAKGGSLYVLKYFIGERSFNPACLGPPSSDVTCPLILYYKQRVSPHLRARHCMSELDCVSTDFICRGI